MQSTAEGRWKLVEDDEVTRLYLVIVNAAHCPLPAYRYYQQHLKGGRALPHARPLARSADTLADGGYAPRAAPARTEPRPRRPRPRQTPAAPTNPIRGRSARCGLSSPPLRRAPILTTPLMVRVTWPDDRPRCSNLVAYLRIATSTADLYTYTRPVVAARPPGRAWRLQFSSATRRARRRRSTPIPRCEPRRWSRPRPRRHIPAAQQRDLRLCAAQSALSLTLTPGNFLAAPLIGHPVLHLRARSSRRARALEQTDGKRGGGVTLAESSLLILMQDSRCRRVSDHRNAHQTTCPRAVGSSPKDASSHASRGTSTWSH